MTPQTHPPATASADPAAGRPGDRPGRGGETTVPDDVVLDAAAELLMTVGVRRTTLAEVARCAGVSRMTLYRRWPDLRALVRAVMTREWARIVTAAAAEARSATGRAAAGGSADGDGSGADSSGADGSGADGGSAGPAAMRAELVRSLVTTAQVFQAHPLFVRISQTDGELLAPYILERLGSTQLLVLDLLRERLVAARAAGAVRDGDQAAHARMVLLATQSYVLSASAFGDETTRDALAHELYLMLDGYLAPPGTPPPGDATPSVPVRPVDDATKHPGASR